MIAAPMKGVRGFLIDSPQYGKLRGIRDGAILIEDGLIAAVGAWDEIRKTPGAEQVRWQHSPETVIIPGLIDVHGHLPQYPVVARTEASLLPWLERHIFPRERNFNAAVARHEAPLFFEDLARNGTTCAMLYAATSEESCDAAFAAAESSGLRIILGNVLMETNSGGPSRGRYLTTVLEQSERLCRKWHGAAEGRLGYAFSPRFAVICSAELMSEAALLARKYDAYVQTHLSENPDEIDAVREKFPQWPDYTSVYAGCGLLGDRTVLGHCVHLEDSEIAQLAAARAVIAHCPTSNFFLSSGLMPLDRLQDAGLRIGLGSDVAAGPELNLWQVMRSAIETQRARWFFDSSVRVPGVAEVFHLATHGGAAALGKEGVIGTLDIGKDADLVVIDLAPVLPYGMRGNIHADLTAEEVIALLVYRGGPHGVVETFVRGRSVYRAPAPLLL